MSPPLTLSADSYNVPPMTASLNTAEKGVHRRAGCQNASAENVCCARGRAGGVPPARLPMCLSPSRAELATSHREGAGCGGGGEVSWIIGRVMENSSASILGMYVCMYVSLVYIVLLDHNCENAAFTLFFFSTFFAIKKLPYYILVEG